MYLTPHQKKQLRLFIILLVGIPLTIFAAYKGIQLISNAGSDATPKEVVLSNLTTNSVTVSWVTDKSADGYVVPLLNGVEQSPVRDKRGSGDRYSHYVEIKSLEPDTQYTFQIVSDSSKYSSTEGNDFKFTTAAVSTTTPVPNPIHGTVTGISDDDVVIYVVLKNKSAYPVSTIIPSGGNWIVDLSAFRKISDKSLITVADDTDLILIAKSGYGKGITVEGKYSELFDSNGKLNDLYSLEVTDTEDLISYFPDEVKLGVSETSDNQELIALCEDTNGTWSSTTTSCNCGTGKEWNSTSGCVTSDSSDNTLATLCGNTGGTWSASSCICTDGKDWNSTKGCITVSSGDNSGSDSSDSDGSNEIVFKITHDLSWIDLVTSGDITNLDSGEDSVMVTNLTDTSFTIVWRSSSKEEGYVKYGENSSSLTEEENDSRDGLTTREKYYSHVVDISRLSPDTTYYFEPYSGDTALKDSGKAFSVTTLSTLSSPPPFDTKSGTLTGVDDPSDWIVIAKLVDKNDIGTSGSSLYVSTTPDENGSWILSIGDARSSDGSDYFSYTSDDDIQMFLLGNSKSTTFALSESDIELAYDSSSTATGQRISLLSNYGILITK